MRFGIQARFAVSLTLLITVFSVVVGGVFLLQTRSSHEEILEATQSVSSRALLDEVRKQNEAMVRLIAEQLVNPLYFNELEVVGNFTTSALDQEEIAYIYVFDASGTVIHDGTETIEAFGHMLDDPEFHLAMNEKRLISTTESPILHTTVPILVGTKILGGVRVGHMLSNIYDSVSAIENELTIVTQSSTENLITSTLLLMAALSISGIITGMMAFGGIARAIEALTETMRDIGQGKYGAALVGLPSNRNDELGELATSVEQMAHSLASSEAKLRKALEIAESASQSKSKFLSSMSHELRTPLNAILGFGQLLDIDKQQLTEKQIMAVKQILMGGEHLLVLVNEVLELASIETGQMKLVIEPIQPAKLVHQCLLMTGSLAAKYSVGIEKDTNAGDMPTIRVDVTRFKQVMLNLLSNAVKYNQENGSVSLACEETADAMVRFNITDTGKGIPQEMHDSLFTPFERLGREASQIEGTGIGLTITKELVELMEGRIGVQSEVGKGSTFWVEFPIAA